MLAPNRVINKILQSKSMDIVKKNSLDDSYFDGYKDEFNFIVDHYNKYGNVPDVVTFLEKFNNFELQEVGETDEFALDKLYENKLYLQFQKGIPLFNQYLTDDSRKAFDYLRDLMGGMQVHNVCPGTDIIQQTMERYDIFKNRANDPEKQVIKTGLPELDDIFGGWEFGDELVTVVARTNQGKCLQKGTKVLMADGSKKNVEDIQIGDYVQSEKGCNKVLALHNGVSNIGWKINVVEDPTKNFTVSDSHILTLFNTVTTQLEDIVIEDYNKLVNDNKNYKQYLLIDKENKKYQFSVEMESNVEYYGFECDGDHRFYLGNGILTHNSWIMMKFLVSAWEQGYTVGLYSGEMNPIKLGYRFDALFKHFSNRALVQGGQVDGYYEYAQEMMQRKNKFIICTQKDFGGKPTVQQIRQFVEENHIQIMGIDQYSLMEDGRASQRDQTRIRLSHIAEDLFLLSSEYKIPILGLAQANREGANKDDQTQAPGLENIKESDDIAHNSSKCIGMRQSSFGLILDIIKNREGRVGDKLMYSWLIDTGHFSYIPSADDAASPEIRQQFTQQNRSVFDASLASNPF